MAKQLSPSKTPYFLPTIGYALGVVDAVSPQIPQLLTSLRATSRGFRTPEQCANMVELIAKYRTFLRPIQIPSGAAPRFPMTNKLAPSMCERMELSYKHHRSQWLIDHIGLHFFPDLQKKDDDSYKRFLEGKRFAKFSDSINTENATFGLVPINARIGDIAVRLVGSDIPFLLRRTIENIDAEFKWEMDKFFVLEMTGDLSVARDAMGFYEFVGEAFVEQAMFEQGRILSERGAFGKRKAFFLL